MGFVSSDLGVCQGTALPPGANPPFWDFDVQDTWKPRLRGECECTYMPRLHVHRSLPAVTCSSVCTLLLIRPKRNVLAQALYVTKCVPSVHGGT